MAKTKNTIKKKYSRVHRFSAAVSMLAFIVILISGMRSDVRMITIAYRSFAVMVVIALVTRVLVKAWASFEELERG
ncbi:MAG: hypothetical protein SGJ02_03170 [bacterium]|nr:hypothetical protein [bacterium]